MPKLNLEPDLGFDVMTLLNLEVGKLGIELEFDLNSTGS